MSSKSGKWFDQSRWIAAVLTASLLLAMGGGSPAVAAVDVHRVTLVLKDFTVKPATFRLKAGGQMALTIKNEGAIEHDWSTGRGVVDTGRVRGYRTDLWALLKPRVTGRHYAVEPANVRPGSDPLWEGERAKLLSTEVDLEPGGWVTLRFTVPANASGTWEFGCFGLGQYAFGMQGTFVVG